MQQYLKGWLLATALCTVLMAGIFFVQQPGLGVGFAIFGGFVGAVLGGLFAGLKFLIAAAMGFPVPERKRSRYFRNPFRSD